MIVSHANRYIFFRNPKTASTSISKGLVKYDKYCTEGFAKNPHGDIEAIIRRWEQVRQWVTEKAGIMKYFGDGVVHEIFPEDFEEYVKIVVVRNPWERILSAYLYLQSGAGGPTNDAEFKKFMKGAPSFSSFLSDLHPDVKCVMHMRDQMNWIRGRRDKKKPFVESNLIIRYERLSEGIEELKKLCNLPDLKIDHYNKTDHTHYTDYYTDKEAEIVYEMYKEDIDYLGYEFGK